MPVKSETVESPDGLDLEEDLLFLDDLLFLLEALLDDLLVLPDDLTIVFCGKSAKGEENCPRIALAEGVPDASVSSSLSESLSSSLLPSSL